jgi:hypothetical protein
MIGAIFCETRPAMIIRSDCRGEPRKTSAPKREMSYREEAMDIISMAQQARPKDMGQIELRRAQLTTLSSEAKRIPSSFRKFSSRPGCSSVTPFAISTDIRLYCTDGGGFAMHQNERLTAESAEKNRRSGL